MKKPIIFVLALAFAAPVLAFADTIPLGPSPLQLATIAVALEAQEAALQSGQSLACAALFGTSSVKVNQPVALAWGSVGALDPATASSSRPMWTPNGATMVSIQTPGTWTYSFTFYAANGGNATCTAKIAVR